MTSYISSSCSILLPAYSHHIRKKRQPSEVQVKQVRTQMIGYSSHFCLVNRPDKGKPCHYARFTHQSVVGPDLSWGRPLRSPGSAQKVICTLAEYSSGTPCGCS